MITFFTVEDIFYLTGRGVVIAVVTDGPIKVGDTILNEIWTEPDKHFLVTGVESFLEPFPKYPRQLGLLTRGSKEEDFKIGQLWAVVPPRCTCGEASLR